MRINIIFTTEIIAGLIFSHATWHSNGNIISTDQSALNLFPC